MKYLFLSIIFLFSNNLISQKIVELECISCDIVREASCSSCGIQTHLKDGINLKYQNNVFKFLANPVQVSIKGTLITLSGSNGETTTKSLNLLRGPSNSTFTSVMQVIDYIKGCSCAANTETITTLVDNGNGTFTYTSEDATQTIFNADSLGNIYTGDGSTTGDRFVTHDAGNLTFTSDSDNQFEALNTNGDDIVRFRVSKSKILSQIIDVDPGFPASITQVVMDTNSITTNTAFNDVVVPKTVFSTVGGDSARVGINVAEPSQALDILGTMQLSDTTSSVFVTSDDISTSSHGLANTGLGFNIFNNSDLGITNVGIGSDIANSAIMDRGNTMIGALNAANGNLDDFNTLLGFASANNTTMASRNIMLGRLAGSSANVASGNTFIGDRSGVSTIGANDVTLIGTLTTAFDNLSRSTALGYNATADKDDQTVLGYPGQVEFKTYGTIQDSSYAEPSLITGSTQPYRNIVVDSAGNFVPTLEGLGGVATIYSASGATDGFRSVEVGAGPFVLQNTTNESNQIAFLHQDLGGNGLLLMTSSTTQLAKGESDIQIVNDKLSILSDSITLRNIGDSALVGINIDTPSQALDIIGQIQLLNTTGDLIIDSQDNDSIVSSDNNTLVGINQKIDTLGRHSVFIGLENGLDAVFRSNNNIGIGRNNFQGAIATGAVNIAIGARAGQDANVESSTTFLGDRAGFGSDVGNGNMFLGAFTGVSTVSGDDALLIGNRNLNGDTIGNEIIAIGNDITSAINVDSSIAMGASSRIDKSHQFVAGPPTQLEFLTWGEIIDSTYGQGNVTGTSAFNIAVDGNGKFIEEAADGTQVSIIDDGEGGTLGFLIDPTLGQNVSLPREILNQVQHTGLDAGFGADFITVRNFWDPNTGTEFNNTIPIFESERHRWAIQGASLVPAIDTAFAGDTLIQAMGDLAIGRIILGDNMMAEVIEDPVRQAGGTFEKYKYMRLSSLGATHSDIDDNTAVGENAGLLHFNQGAGGTDNTSLGVGAGSQNATGDNNIAIGVGAGNTAGGSTVIIGNNAGDDSNLAVILGNGAGASGTVSTSFLGGINAGAVGNITNSVWIGHNANNVGTGLSSNNVGIGSGVGSGMTTGAGNVLIGSSAGAGLTGGIGNIYIGNQAAATFFGTNTSNRLYIDNSNTATPLILGDFSTNELSINGRLEAVNNDMYVTNSLNGVILTSPDATCWRVTVLNGGALATTSIACP